MWRWMASCRLRTVRSTRPRRARLAQGEPRRYRRGFCGDLSSGGQVGDAQTDFLQVQILCCHCGLSLRGSTFAALSVTSVTKQHLHCIERSEVQVSRLDFGFVTPALPSAPPQGRCACGPSVASPLAVLRVAMTQPICPYSSPFSSRSR